VRIVRDWAVRVDRALAVVDIGLCSSLQVFDPGAY
jgi:hypothetical protein